MLSLIIEREYTQRVRRKSFIITTLLIPVLMIIMMVLPTLIMIWQTPEDVNVTVVDQSGVVAQQLTNDGDIIYNILPVVEANGQEQATQLANDDHEAIVLLIGPDAVQDPADVTMLAYSAVPIEVESQISDQLSDIIADIRLKSDPALTGTDVAELRAAIDRAEADVAITTVRLDRDDEEAASAGLSVAIGMLMTFVLYMIMLMYGQLVMTSIIEEKNNRVLELVVSSTSPTKLMLGKILGVGLVALTQILIWALLIGSVSTFVMPMLLGKIASSSSDMAAIMEPLSNAGYVLGIFGYMTLFLIGGFLLYASIFAAIGSAVDNVQDASQLTSFAVIPIILALVISMSAATNPNSSLAIWCSFIPFTSPMVMMARIPSGIAAWEIWVSLAILYASFMVLVWLAAKIYRIGIFTYGKKPTIKDLVRWARYK